MGVLFTHTSIPPLASYILSTRVLKRDVVYLSLPIAPSYMSPNAGGGGGWSCGMRSRQWGQLYTGNKLWRSNFILLLFLLHGTELRVVFFSAEGFGTEFRDFLFRGTTGIPSEITICSVFRGIIFLFPILTVAKELYQCFVVLRRTIPVTLSPVTNGN